MSFSDNLSSYNFFGKRAIWNLTFWLAFMKMVALAGGSHVETGKAGQAFRLLRGGAWNNNNRANLRCANRNNNIASARNNNYGLRVARGR